jgi:predicted GH43/DUF377 family glycosyl hydrolase
MNGPFLRHQNNPIITAADIPYTTNTVFNPGAIKFGDETLLLMRMEDREGISHLTTARSLDGVGSWSFENAPALSPEPDKYPEEIWGIEDPRITFLEEMDKWAVAYVAYSKSGPMVSLALTDNFQTFYKISAVLPPENKDAALFPVKFQGKWAMLHRPMPVTAGIGAHIWIAFSPDLIHWGGHQVVIPARRGGFWDANKIGLSAPPLLTEEGWLILYHGVRKTVSTTTYRVGLALLDRDDPRRLIQRSNEWLFAPHEPYERIGDVGNVVFPCGWILEGEDIRLYYGGADSCIGLAISKKQELLQWLKEHSNE